MLIIILMSWGTGESLCQQHSSSVVYQEHSLHPRSLSPCKLVTSVIGLALWFGSPGIPWLTLSSLRLPEDNSPWVHLLLPLVLFEMPRLCGGGVQLIPLFGTGTLMRNPCFRNITGIWWSVSTQGFWVSAYVRTFEALTKGQALWSGLCGASV